MNIVLLTDDQVLRDVLPHYFSDCTVHVYSPKEPYFLEGPCDEEMTLIMGYPSVEVIEWDVTKSLKEQGIPFYMMVRSPIDRHDIQRIEGADALHVLLDPVSQLLRCTQSQGRVEALFIKLEEERLTDDNIVLLGRETYFHRKEWWIHSPGRQAQLTDREVLILEYLIDHPGKVLTVEILSKEFWAGSVTSNAISKAIKRLRQKMGPAGELIRGRQAGGWIYQST